MFLLVSTCYSAEYKVNTQINTVQFYPSSGKISRNGKVSLPVGDHILSFENLSIGIINQDFRFYADEGIELQFIDFESAPEKHYLYKKSKKSLDSIEKIIKVIKNIDGGYKKELEVLNANKAISSKNAFVEPDDIELISVYNRKKHIQIYSIIDSLNEIISELEVRKKEIGQDWQIIHSLLNNFQVVKAYVKVKKSSSFNIGLEYMVNSMGWEQYYQIKVEDDKQTARIELNARVYQNTLENFNNVDATFYSREPQFSGEITQLNPWYIFDYSSFVLTTATQSSKVSRGAGANPNDNEDDKNRVFDPFDVESITKDESIQYSFTLNQKLFLKFTTIQKFETQFPLKFFEVPLSLMYKAQPRNSDQAFLIASLTEWSSLGLIPGNAKLFMNNVALSDYYLNTNLSDDTLSLNFGYDPRISISYTREKLQNSRQFLGTNKTSSFAYKTQIKNNSSKPIEIEIINQVPVSTDTRIEISVGSTKGADYDKDKGLVTRKLKILPGGLESYIIDFSVKHPKSMEIMGL
jgi:uncharacterized protein (TIGR02231 family)